MDQQPPSQPVESGASPATGRAEPAASGQPTAQTPSGPSAGAGAPDGEPIAAGAGATDTPSPAAEALAPEPALVSIDQFGQIDLRVAVVRGYERVAGTDRLLKLEIDLGTERRTIVSGIAHLVDPETLVGRRIVVVANLQPARIRGVESRGMLLAAGGRGPGEAFALVSVPDNIAPGTRVS